MALRAGAGVLSPVRRDGLTSARVVPESDQYFTNLNRRLMIGLNGLLLIFPVVFLIVCATQAITLPMAAIHLGSYVLVLGFMRLSGERDAAVMFMVTHCFWLYSLMLFLYALVYWKSPEEDLYAPILSSLIAMTALVACLAGWVIAKLLKRLIGVPRARVPATRLEQRTIGLVLVLVSAPFTMLPVLNPDSSILNSISALFDDLLLLGVVVYAAGRGPKVVSSPVIYGVVGIVFAGAILLNARGSFLSVVLAILIIYFGISRTPLRPVRLLAAYIAANAMNALSNVMLSARILYGHAASAAVVARSMASSDFVLAVLGFDRLGKNVAVVVSSQLVRTDHYLLYMFDGRLGLFERLTEMPHMDIVMSQLPYPVPVNPTEIKNALLSSLPSVGQTKDVLLNDRLVWDTSLIPTTTIGHPLVTAVGEFYSMGGFWTLFIIFSLVLAATLFFYEISKRVFASVYVAAAALIIFSIYLVFSSTSVSALCVPLRIYPVAFVVYPLARLTLGWFWPGIKRPDPLAAYVAS